MYISVKCVSCVGRIEVRLVCQSRDRVVGMQGRRGEEREWSMCRILSRCTHLDGAASEFSIHLSG